MSEERTHKADPSAKAATEQARFDRILAAKQWREDNYLANPGFADCAAAFGVSRYHFHREFHAVAGMTFKAYVDDLRIEEAKRRLLAGVRIDVVALSLMFSHQSHFTSRFKLLTGETPRAWRQRALAEQGRMKAEAA